MNNELATRQGLGQAANAAASENIFTNYLFRKAANTQVRHEKEIRNFSSFLSELGYTNNGMTTPEEWSGITFGLIEGYQHYMLQHGYSVNSTNQTIYIIKAYAGLAGKAGYIDYVELARIREIKGFKTGEAVHIDQQRKAAGTETRISTKKQQARNLSSLQVEQLKHQHPDTLKGKRDALIFAIFLDMGLRESELMSLTRDSFDLDNRLLHWHREKTNNNGHETMSRDVVAAAAAYFAAIPAADQHDLFVTISKAGTVTGSLTMRGLQSIVKAAGKEIGISNLSPHDLRHSMALRAYLAGIPLKSIQRRLGHSTVKTTERYIDIEALDRYNDFDRDF